MITTGFELHMRRRVETWGPTSYFLAEDKAAMEWALQEIDRLRAEAARRSPRIYPLTRRDLLGEPDRTGLEMDRRRLRGRIYERPRACGKRIRSAARSADAT